MRRLASALVTLALTTVATAVALIAGSPANAIPVGGWYMLVNDYYDGTSGYDGGVMWCLSTNSETSPSGAGTHQLYLATCDADVPGQWWRFDGSGDTTIESWRKYSGYPYDVSGNTSPVPGGDQNTFGAFSARSSSAKGHGWVVYTVRGGATNRYMFENGLSGQGLSVSHNVKYTASTWRVYTSRIPSPAAPVEQQVWRFFQPVAYPPAYSA
ncbi:hypothetical protein [Actinoplanes couchii]|uniref:Ricin B lectin domain-containing protein n=1 Tax=Actinoplanes couchii TaxID=403638 RepID=A0ABQ3XNL5_9ACTN|nr:hypothetical protein [Actinoplanes couchii]MDR6319677.1 hypothetical protein [Actinoplanes couchii]GID60103.1 hypothetical protein Aco03nite_085070 [Actinoplanes couchii]